MPVRRPALLAALAVLLPLAACTSYPLGMSEAEWLALSPAQQLEARQTQAELDAQDARRRAAERAEAERRAQAEEQERQRTWTALRHNARYGDIVQCVVSGTADFRPGWRPIDRAGVSLVRGEVGQITLSEHAGRRSKPLWAAFSQDGMTVTLCRYDPLERGYHQGKDCTRAVGTALDYQTGLTQPIDLPEILRGSLHCTYQPAPGMPRHIIVRPAKKS